MAARDEAARSFESTAETYERARPGYPAELIRRLADRLDLAPGRTVLDLGAGTGKLSRLLVGTGVRVVALEPLAGMRAELERAVPDAEPLAASAEAIPLGDASVDAVTAAQAFHWFRAEEALREIHRVLVPGGGLALIWNQVDAERTELARRIEALLEPGRARVRGEFVAWRDIAAWELFTPLETERFPCDEEMPTSRYLEMLSSVSHVSTLPPAERSRLLAEIESLIGGDTVFVPRFTELHLCFRR